MKSSELLETGPVHLNAGRGKRALTLFGVSCAMAVVAWAGPAMSIDDCVAYARRHSPGLRQLEIDIEGQKLATLEERAEFAVSMGVLAEHNIEDGSNFGELSADTMIVGGIEIESTISVEDGESAEPEYSATISKIILGGGSVLDSRLEVNNSLIDEVIALNERNRFRRQLEYFVGEAYYGVTKSMQTLRIQELRLGRAKKNLEVAEERGDPLDIATARLEVPQHSAEVLQARREIQSSLDELKELMGMEVAAELQVEPTFDFREERIALESDIEHCLDRYEEILNLRLEGRKLENTARVLRSRRWPEVKVLGTVWRQNEEIEETVAGDAVTPPPEPAGIEYLVGAALEWDIGSMAERARYRAAVNDIRRNELGLRAVRLRQTRTVRDIARRLEETVELLRLQEERVKVNTAQVELYADSWAKGEIDILEYIRSQNDLEESRIELIDLKSAYMEQLAEYRYEAAK